VEHVLHFDQIDPLPLDRQMGLGDHALQAADAALVTAPITWVRLAQRIPVGIHVTHVPPGVLISAGMTCTVVMKEGAAPEIGLGIRTWVTVSATDPKSWSNLHQADDAALGQ
jgi:hypothetical protein